LYIPRQTFLVRCPEKSTERSVVADYLKLPEVARRLDVSEKTARRMVKSGSLPAVFIGGAYRISEEDLAAYLQSAKVQPGKASASPSQRRLFNGEERRAFIERCERYVAARVAHYENRLAVAKRGGLFAGFVGAKTLQDEAFEEFSQLLDVQNGELVERWLNDPEVPETVKEELGFDLTEVQRPFIQVVGRIGDRVKELADTQDEKDEAERRHDEIRKWTDEINEIGKSA
jgi:excisionase family DNA binding protein